MSATAAQVPGAGGAHVEVQAAAVWSLPALAMHRPVAALQLYPVQSASEMGVTLVFEVHFQHTLVAPPGHGQSNELWPLCC
jgi:hypothetical protein